jgi:hypothetical protein
MGKVKGIVMEINKNSAIIMTHDGKFINIKKPPFEISLGDEITSKPVNTMSFMKCTAIAAAIMILVLPFIYFKQAMATVAYVDVDINPSLELGINRYNKVSSITPLNSDGSKLIKDISLDGLHINDALGKVISKAKDMGYIGDSKPNNIEVTLVKLKDKANISQKELVEYTESAVKKSNVDAKLKFYNADEQAFDNAKKENISPNKYMDKSQNKDKLEIDVKKSSLNSNDNKKNKTIDKGNGNPDKKSIKDDKHSNASGKATLQHQERYFDKSKYYKGNASENKNKNSVRTKGSKGSWHYKNKKNDNKK